MPLKIDLHVHSYYSSDSVISPEDILHYARKQGLDGVAIVDHDRLDGAQRIAKALDFLVIPGVEISSSGGHVVGLCVSEQVQSGLDVNETVDKIHASNGIAVACHPTTLFKKSLGNRTTRKFDAVEVINSSALPFNYSIRRAERLAFSLQLPRVAGTDAHYGPEIGFAYTLIDAKPKIEDVLEAIRRGRCSPFGQAIPLRLRMKGKAAATFKR